MTLLLAIGPIVILPAIAAVAAIAAIARLAKKKPAAIPPPQPDPAIGGGGGGGGTVAAPYLNVRIEDLKGSLTRDSVAWRWTVARGEAGVASGSDQSPGGAAGDLLEALRDAAGTRIDDAPLLGVAGGGGNPPVNFSVEADEGTGTWDWTVTTVTLPKAGQPPTPPKLLAAGSVPVGTNALSAYATAVITAMAEVAKYIDWMQMVGAATPTPGNGGLKLPLVKQFHGLATTVQSVGVTDLQAWLAYAAPLVRADIDANPNITADALMDQVLGADYADGVKLSGKPIAEVRKLVDRTLTSIRGGTYLGATSPDRKLAAEMVGDSYTEDGSVFLYHGYTYLVRPTAAPNRWEFLIWRGSMRQLDGDAVRNGGIVGNRNNAIRRARSVIDEMGGP